MREFARLLAILRYLTSLGAMLGATAWAQSLAGRAVGSYQLYESPEYDSSTFMQLYELRLHRQISSAIQYRLSGRAQDNRGNSYIGELQNRLLTQELTPTAEIVWTPSQVIHSQLGYNLLWTRTPLTPAERLLERAYARLSYRPEGLPGLSLQAERRGNRAAAFGLDQTETLFHSALDYQYADVQVTQANSYAMFVDHPALYNRDTVQSTAQIAFQHSFLQDRLGASASLTGAWTRLQEHTGATVPVSAANEQAIVLALSAIDETPLDGADRPLLPNLALIDGDAAVPASISIGPDGSLSWNIALDVGRVLTLDEIRVDVRAPDGSFVTSGGDVSWIVYTSIDQIHWTLVSAGTFTSFNATLSRYELALQPTTARYFKIVNSGVNVFPTWVTEVQAVLHTTIEPSAPRTSANAYGGATVGLVAKPMKEVVISYLGQLNAFRQLLPETNLATSLDYDQNLAISADPFRFLNVSLRYGDHRVRQSTGFTQMFDVAALDLGWTFIPAIHTVAGVYANYQDNLGRISTANGLRLQNLMRVYRTLMLNVDGGYERQIWTNEVRYVDKLYVSGLAEAQVTRGLRLTGQATLQRNQFRGGQAEDVPILPGRDERYLLEAAYRASQQFAAAVRLGYAGGDQLSGIVQRYRLDWYPFPDGSIRVGFTYDQDVDPYAGRIVRRLAIVPHWAINRYSNFDLNYSLSLVDRPEPTRTSIFQATFSLIL